MVDAVVAVHGAPVLDAMVDVQAGGHYETLGACEGDLAPTRWSDKTVPHVRESVPRDVDVGEPVDEEPPRRRRRVYLEHTQVSNTARCVRRAEREKPHPKVRPMAEK